MLLQSPFHQLFCLNFSFKLKTFSKSYARKQKWVFFSEHCVLVVIITLCSLLGLCGGKKTTEKLGNITADVVIGAVHRSETQRCDIVKLRCVEERRLIHQLTQALQQHSRSNDFFCLNFKYVQKIFFYFGSVFSQIQNKFDLILFEKKCTSLWVFIVIYYFHVILMIVL